MSRFGAGGEVLARLPHLGECDPAAQTINQVMAIIAEHWVTDEGVHLNVQRATGFSRLRGLIARRRLAPASALLIPDCNSVHGMGMTRSVDVAFVSSAGCVLAVHRLRPLGAVRRIGAAQVFEFAAGEPARLGITLGSLLSPAASAEQSISRGAR